MKESLNLFKTERNENDLFLSILFFLIYCLDCNISKVEKKNLVQSIINY
jgi:hypothetical protein